MTQQAELDQQTVRELIGRHLQALAKLCLLLDDRKPANGQLSRGELQVATLAMSGLSNRDIARQLFLSPNTVNTVMRRVFKKLGVHHRRDLAQALSRAGDAP